MQIKANTFTGISGSSGNPVSSTVHEVGSGTGSGGKIEVKVIIKDGAIADVEIISQSETEGIGGVALPEYVKQTIEKNGLDIDVITGATVTLDGYKEAVNAALSQALS